MPARRRSESIRPGPRSAVPQPPSCHPRGQAPQSKWTTPTRWQPRGRVPRPSWAARADRHRGPSRRSQPRPAPPWFRPRPGSTGATGVSGRAECTTTRAWSTFQSAPSAARPECEPGETARTRGKRKPALLAGGAEIRREAQLEAAAWNRSEKLDPWLESHLTRPGRRWQGVSRNFFAGVSRGSAGRGFGSWRTGARNPTGPGRSGRCGAWPLRPRPGRRCRCWRGCRPRRGR